MSSRLRQSSTKVARIVPRFFPAGSVGATASVNTGLSWSDRRIQNVTSTITAESRNGTRQPQLSSWSWGNV